MTQLVVQKYGGSVLADEKAFLRAARHVARTVAGGSRVVAVVSAQAGWTDALQSEARRLNPGSSAGAKDLLLATGELRSAALLALALEAEGLEAAALNPWQLGLHTDGRGGGARITRINPLHLRLKIHEHPAVIVPGFIGRGKDGRLTTLGRGGSDLTAVALADTLGAAVCAFFKDVPGYFSADPRLIPEAVHRPEVSVEEAFQLSRFGCRFLQDRAIAWALESRCRLELRALDGEERATVLRRNGGARGGEIQAMTHCEIPGSLRGKVPFALGENPVLLSLVGEGIGRDGRLERRAVRELERAGVLSHPVDRSGVRVTLAVAAKDGVRAQRRLHDGLVLSAEGPPGRSGRAAGDAGSRETKQRFE